MPYFHIPLRGGAGGAKNGWNREPGSVQLRRATEKGWRVFYALYELYAWVDVCSYVDPLMPISMWIRPHTSAQSASAPAPILGAQQSFGGGSRSAWRSRQKCAAACALNSGSPAAAWCGQQPLPLAGAAPGKAAPVCMLVARRREAAAARLQQLARGSPLPPLPSGGRGPRATAATMPAALLGALEGSAAAPGARIIKGPAGRASSPGSPPGRLRGP